MITFVLLADLAKVRSKLPVSNERGAYLSPAARDVVLIVLAVFFIALVSILWAVYLRRESRRDRRSPTIVEPSAIPFKRRHRRRKRKESVSRNPTLAETGGLPPVKEKPANPMQGL
jgi:hypothetical protein